jgi:hypothetical protein
MNTMIVSIDNSVDIGNIAASVRRLKGVSEVKIGEKAEFERIAGLPYTHEERLKSVCLAEEDIRAGRVYSAVEVRAMFPKP